MGPANDKQQAPTNRLKLYSRAVISSEASPTVLELKRESWLSTMIRFRIRHADHIASLVCDVLLCFVTFQCGFLGQVFNLKHALFYFEHPKYMSENG